MTLSSTALASHLLKADCHAAVPAALQLTTLTAARTLAGHVGASFAATSMISIPTASLVEGALNAMFANQVKAMAFPLFIVAGTVATAITVVAAQLGGGAGPRNQLTPASATSKELRKAQGQPPSSKSAVPELSASLDFREAVSPELARELNHAATVFGRLLSAIALRDLKLEDINRLDQWSTLTLQAQQRLSNSHPDRVAVAEAHRDRVKRLHLLITNLVGTGPDNGLLKLTSIKLNDANQMLAGEREDKRKDSRRPPIDIAAAAETSAPPETPKADLPSSASGSRGGGSAQNRVDTSSQMSDGATRPLARSGMMDGMGMMTRMMRGGRDLRGSSSTEDANRQMRTQIAGLAADLATREKDPKNRVTLKKLEEPISMSFAAATPLEDVLTYVRQATTTPTYPGIPIYVDPKGLKEASATNTSAVTLDLPGVSLKTTLRLLLKQIGLAYCVRDGVLIISSVEGVNEELSEALRELEATTPVTGGFGGGFGGGRGLQ